MFRNVATRVRFPSSRRDAASLRAKRDANNRFTERMIAVATKTAEKTSASAVDGRPQML